MNKLKLAAVSAGAFLLFGAAGIAFATTPATYHIGITPDSGPDYIADISAPSYDGHTVYLVGFDPTSGAPMKYYINNGITNSAGQLDVFDVPSSAVQTLDNFKTDTNASLSTLTSNMSSTVSSLNSLTTTVSALGPPLDIGVFMGNNASTSPYVATSTINGFISYTDKIKLDGLSAPAAWSAATSSHSIVTGTGATGFQVSSTRNATVNYNVKITTTASIAGNADGYITLEVAPTNSATAADWVEVGRCGNSQALTLAITLQSVQGTTCQLSVDLPTGTYAKLRSVTTTGTVSFVYVSGRETLK